MLTNRDTGLIRLAGKRGLLTQEAALDLVRRVQAGDQREGEALLAEAGLDAETIGVLVKAQRQNSIPSEFDGFRVLGIVGRGGMSVVLKAQRLASGEVVAIKLLSPHAEGQRNARERFHREMRSAVALVHPNIVRCFETGETNGRPYLALEYMAGGDLGRRLEAGERLDERACLRMTRDIGRALCGVRDARLMHRDIKPWNIFMDEAGTAKLADLGLAKPDDDEQGLTLLGTSVGTPAYMSPEQALGRPDIDLRGDLFSLGSTLYHLLAGEQPFGGTTAQETMRAVVREEPRTPIAALTQFLPGTRAILHALMAKRPDDRYQDPADLVADVDRLLMEGDAFQITSLRARGSGSGGQTVPRSDRGMRGSSGGRSVVEARTVPTTERVRRGSGAQPVPVTDRSPKVTTDEIERRGSSANRPAVPIAAGPVPLAPVPTQPPRGFWARLKHWWNGG